MSRCKACDQIMTEYEMKKKDPVNVNLFLDLCGTCSQYSNDALFDGDGDTGKLDADSLDSLVNIAYNT
jgi:hypothetical protein|tara:strand:+ start:170 stop:373 length:204 start_codon:yes stop_codon:yes gene_type:complete